MRVQQSCQLCLDIVMKDRMILLRGAIQQFFITNFILCDFGSTVTILLMIGANPPSKLSNPLRKAAAVLIHLPSSEE